MPSAFRVLSVIPPMTQLNTPYPSTAYLTGFLRSRGIDAVQADLALALNGRAGNQRETAGDDFRSEQDGERQQSWFHGRHGRHRPGCPATDHLNT